MKLLHFLAKQMFKMAPVAAKRNVFACLYPIAAAQRLRPR